MTEYERGFKSVCNRAGLSDRDAGALCKLAYFWDSQSGMEGGRNRNMYNGRNDALAKYFADTDMDDAERQDFLHKMNLVDSGRVGTAWDRLWNRMFHSRSTNYDWAKKKTEDQIQQVADMRSAERLRTEMRKRQADRTRGITNWNKAPADAELGIGANNAAQPAGGNVQLASSPFRPLQGPGFSMRNGHAIWG